MSVKFLMFFSLYYKMSSRKIIKELWVRSLKSVLSFTYMVNTLLYLLFNLVLTQVTLRWLWRSVSQKFLERNFNSWRQQVWVLQKGNDWGHILEVALQRSSWYRTVGIPNTRESPSEESSARILHSYNRFILQNCAQCLACSSGDDGQHDSFDWIDSFEFYSHTRIDSPNWHFWIGSFDSTLWVGLDSWVIRLI